MMQPTGDGGTGGSSAPARPSPVLAAGLRVGVGPSSGLLSPGLSLGSAPLPSFSAPPTDPLARAQYFHARTIQQPWPEVPLAARGGSGGGGGVTVGSNSSVPRWVHTPEEPDQPQVQLTPHEVREEREHERSRRRLALRKKAERARNGSLPTSPQPDNGLGLGLPPLPHPNDMLHAHPSLQQHVASVNSQGARPRSLSNRTSDNAFRPSPASPVRVAPLSARASSSSQFGNSQSGLLSSSARRSTSDSFSHRIDIPSEPEDTSTMVERAHDSMWAAIRDWDPTQRQRALTWAATCEAIVSIAFLLLLAWTWPTTFANPPVHWCGQVLALLSLALAYLLRVGALRMSMHHVLIWLVCAGLMIGALIVLAILAFHGDVIAMDVNMRDEWNRVLTQEEKMRNYHDHFEELKERCKFHLTLIGIGAASLAGILFTLFVMVGTVRSHIFDEEDHETSSTARQSQFQQRLQHRQRLARLGAQMKERRRLRKARGGRASTSGFTGLGSHAASPSGNWSEDSLGGVELTTLNSGVPDRAQQPSPLESAASTLLAPPDADEQRYAGMLSEDIEEELDRAVTLREAQDHHAMPL